MIVTQGRTRVESPRRGVRCARCHYEPTGPTDAAAHQAEHARRDGSRP